MPQCHSEISDDSRFCSECGSSIHPFEEISVPIETFEALDLLIVPYERFIDLREDVDPVIAEVEDAKKGQAGLKKS